jgi:hypothetical protein
MTAPLQTLRLRCLTVRCLTVAGLAAVLSLSAASCKRDDQPLSRFSCRCTFLTDTDDTSEQRVEVCGTAADSAAYEAEGCAQSAAPAPIQACQCQPVTSNEPCGAKTCKISDYR